MVWLGPTTPDEYAKKYGEPPPPPPPMDAAWLHARTERGIYTRNPFAMLGFLIAWLVTGGQQGRLPWWKYVEPGAPPATAGSVFDVGRVGTVRPERGRRRAP